MLALTMDMPQRAVLGTSLAAMVAPCIAALIKLHPQRVILYGALPVLLLGTALGAAVGSNIVQHLPERELRAIFSVGMVTMGGRMALGR